MKKLKKRFFFVFEGGEGSGKSTQAKLFYEWLVKKGHNALLTKEPGGDDGVCAEIRKVLMDEKFHNQLTSKTEMLLFVADRAQHVEKVIRPALEEGKIVVCDRFDAANYAYQCGGRGIDSTTFFTINDYAKDKLEPNFWFWIDIVDPRLGLERNFKAGKRDRFEVEDINFHYRVHQGYADFFKHISLYDRTYINGLFPVDEVHKQVLDSIKHLHL